MCVKVLVDLHSAGTTQDKAGRRIMHLSAQYRLNDYCTVGLVFYRDAFKSGKAAVQMRRMRDKGKEKRNHNTLKLN